MGWKGALRSINVEIRRQVRLLSALLVCIAGCGDPASCAECEQQLGDMEAELAACRAGNESTNQIAGPVVPSEPVEEEVLVEEEVPANPVAPANLWETGEFEDELTGRPIVMRTARSSEPFELASPYDRPQFASLTIRQHPQHGNDVILRIERGQFVCRIRGCSVNVVFDGSDPVQWQANEAAAGISTSLFLRNHDRFVRRLEEASEVRVAASLYRRGTMTFVFPGLSEELPTEGDDDGIATP